jgi:hypothetical protein
MLTVLTKSGIAHNARHVELRTTSPNSLTVVAKDGDQVLGQWVLSKDKGEFDCDNGQIRLSTQFDAASGQQAMGAGSTSTTLSRSGSFLVVRQDTTGFALAAIFPIAFRGTTWHRYDRIAP